MGPKKQGQTPELMEFNPDLSWGVRKCKRGEKRSREQGFVSFFTKESLLLGHARSEPVEGEAPEEAWQTVTR